ncbi:hypothetical protein L6R50_05985 [Myxococcota bacterium]|nr:hypothetical protein [Myxococcota bacterium]
MSPSPPKEEVRAASPRRVVVVGLGVVVPVGVGVPALREAAAGGRGGISRHPEDRAAALPPGVGGRVPREALKGRFDGKLLRLSTMSEATLLGACAASEALEGAGLRHSDGPFPEAGVYVGSYICPPAFDKQAKTALALTERDAGSPRGWRLDDERLPHALKSQSAFDFLKALPNMIASHVSIQGHLAGPVGTFLGSDASGLQAVGEAYHAVRAGEAEVMLAGAAWSPFQEVLLAWLRRRGLLGRGDGDLGTASRPDSEDADGMIPGEGAAFVVLEERERALGRGARVHGEVVGYSSRFAVPGGESDVRARADALARAIPPGLPVEAVVLDGTAVPWNDRADREAVSLAFPRGRPRILPSASGPCGFLGPATGPVNLVAALADPRPGLALACSFSVDGTHAVVAFQSSAP